MRPGAATDEAQAKTKRQTFGVQSVETGENQAPFPIGDDKSWKRHSTYVNIDEMLDDMTVVYQRQSAAQMWCAHRFLQFAGRPASARCAADHHERDMPMVMKRTQERSAALIEGLTNDLEQFAKSIARLRTSLPPISRNQRHLRIPSAAL